MAKMFYNVEEAMSKLGCSEEQVRKLAQDGAIREFKDCGKSIFKVEEIDNLALGGGVDLGASSTDEVGLADTAEDITLGGSTLGGSSIGDIDLLPMDTGTSLGLSSTATGDAISLNASDSLGELSLEDTTASNDDTVVTSFGTNALSASSLGDDDFSMGDLADDDLGDQISLDSASSGSGLLDLSREADETSLGAELLEEIYPGQDDAFGEGAPGIEMPGGTAAPAALEEANAPAAISAEPAMAPMAAAMPMSRAVQIYDESSGKFGGMLLAPLLILIYMACVAFSSVNNVKLPLISDTLNPKIGFIAAGGLVWVIIFLIASFMGGSDGGTKTAKASPKAPKKAKAKKPKKTKKKK